MPACRHHRERKNFFWSGSMTTALRGRVLDIVRSWLRMGIRPDRHSSRIALCRLIEFRRAYWEMDAARRQT
jgi:hypothetical protein